MKILFGIVLLLLSSSLLQAQQDTNGSVADTSLKSQHSESLMQVYDTADIMPQYPGGQDSMFRFILNHLDYPKKAREEGVSGRVLAEFVVTETGKLEDIRIVKSVSPECDQEVIRIIKLMPDWVPGIKDGKAVRVKMNLPFRFQLG